MCIFEAVAVTTAAGAASTAAATTAGLSALSAGAFGGAAVGGVAASTAATAAAGATLTGAAATSAVAAGTATWAVSPAFAFMSNLAIAGSAINAIAGPAMQYMGQQQAKAYQEQLYDYNKQVSEQNLSQQYMMLSRRQAEEQRKFGEEMGIIAQRSAQARATALVSSVESGVSGLSVDSLMNNYYRQQSEFMSQTQQQQKAALFQTEMQKEQARSGYQGQVLSAMPTAAGGSPLALGLGITGGLSGLYSDIYMNNTDRQTLRTALRI
jgi:hypothetical protein